MIKYFKNRWFITLLALIIIMIGSYWFYTKFFPAQTGVWNSSKAANFKEDVVPTSGWEGENFWTSVDYPEKQNTCLNIHPKTLDLRNQNVNIPVTQAPRAVFYPIAGDLTALFQQYSPAAIAEDINQEKPLILNHLAGNITREGKNIFFKSDSEKFLIPTVNIFSAYFPNLNIPDPSPESTLDYSNKLINFPEGVLLSDGKGVFIMENRQLFLVRSPEVFESLGYKWEDIRQMSNIDLSFNSYQSGNLVDFDAAHSNGTIINDNQNFFLVWNEKLYSLSEEEKARYFVNTPVVSANKHGINSICKITPQNISCCLANLDPRLDPPNYSPFANTLSWDLSQITAKDQVKDIEWQSKIALNQENLLHRLGGLKNYILYTSGIAK